MKKNADELKEMIEGALQAGEAMKKAMASSGACLVITVEKVPEGLALKYFSFSLLSVSAAQQVIDNQSYQTFAREAEERMRGEITPSGPVN